MVRLIGESTKMGVQSTQTGNAWGFKLQKCGLTNEHGEYWTGLRQACWLMVDNIYIVKSGINGHMNMKKINMLVSFVPWESILILVMATIWLLVKSLFLMLESQSLFARGHPFGWKKPISMLVKSPVAGSILRSAQVSDHFATWPSPFDKAPICGHTTWWWFPKGSPKEDECPVA